ncbi:hypothetical protein CEXT_560101 [Caerostris extrusa]|uniref:Uncharacterized protein n=1 Tax=Caerostris extrusa TaxID=172846 RepID=A0AAV4XNU5_CAEEX|nr:hypothetical protein CEXT_560101 [Caerostris extrusa]
MNGATINGSEIRVDPYRGGGVKRGDRGDGDCGGGEYLGIRRDGFRYGGGRGSRYDKPSFGGVGVYKSSSYRSRSTMGPSKKQRWLFLSYFKLSAIQRNDSFVRKVLISQLIYPQAKECVNVLFKTEIVGICLGRDCPQNRRNRWKATVHSKTILLFRSAASDRVRIRNLRKKKRRFKKWRNPSNEPNPSARTASVISLLPLTSENGCTLSRRKGKRVGGGLEAELVRSGPMNPRRARAYRSYCDIRSSAFSHASRAAVESRRARMLSTIARAMFPSVTPFINMIMESEKTTGKGEPFASLIGSARVSPCKTRDKIDSRPKRVSRTTLRQRWAKTTARRKVLSGPRMEF